MYCHNRPINITIYGTEVGNGLITWDGIFIPYSSLINQCSQFINPYFYDNSNQEDTCTDICPEYHINTVVSDDDVDRLLEEYWDCVHDSAQSGQICVSMCFDPLVGESIISCCIDKYCAYRKARDSWLKKNGYKSPNLY